MTNYQKNKERARKIAIRYQHAQNIIPMYLGNVAYWNEKLARWAKMYGLTHEFKENGII